MATQSVITCILIVYLFYCFFKKKRVVDLFLIAILVSLQLHTWPFFIPRQFCDAGLAVAMAGFSFYDSTKEKSKKSIIYGLVFLYFAIIAAVQ